MFVCYSMDATEEPVEGPSMGRLVNHSKCGNACVRVVSAMNRPYVCLFATGDISSGDQICYDYGVTIPFEDKVL